MALEESLYRNKDKLRVWRALTTIYGKVPEPCAGFWCTMTDVSWLVSGWPWTTTLSDSGRIGSSKQDYWLESSCLKHIARIFQNVFTLHDFKKSSAVIRKEWSPKINWFRETSIGTCSSFCAQTWSYWNWNFNCKIVWSHCFTQASPFAKP